MSDYPTPRTHISRQELLGAVDVACAKAEQLAGEAITGDDQVEGHSRANFRDKVKFIARFFLQGRDSEESFEIKTFFDFLRKIIQPHNQEADSHREYLAASEQLLKALDLKRQFIEYNRSVSNKESSKEPHDEPSNLPSLRSGRKF